MEPVPEELQAHCEVPLTPTDPRPVLGEDNKLQNFNIRLARASDLYRISSIAALAFWNEDCNGRTLHPLRSRDPQSVFSFWRRSMRSNLADKANHMLFVAVADADTTPLLKEKEESAAPATIPRSLPNIIGYVDLGFVSSSSDDRPAAFPAQPWYSFNSLIVIPLSNLINFIDNLLFPDRILNPKAGAIYQGLKEALQIYTHSHGERQESHPVFLYVHTLGVHPNFRGHKVGTKLIERCHQIAARENLPIGLACAEGTREFYRKVGFPKDFGNITGDIKETPLAGIRGGEMVFTR